MAKSFRFIHASKKEREENKFLFSKPIIWKHTNLSIKSNVSVNYSSLEKKMKMDKN